MRIYLHGNCQTSVLRKMMLEAGVDADIRSREVHVIDLDKDIDDYVEDVRSADVIIAQPVNPNYRNENRLSTGWIMANRSAHSELLTFSSVYFQGYTPSVFYLRPHDAYGMPYHDVHIADMFCAGMTAGQILQRLEDPDFFSPDFIESELQRSIAELQTREDQGISVRTSDIVAERCRSQTLFHTVNHPSRSFFRLLLGRILQRIGLAAEAPEQGPEHLGGIVVPPYAATIVGLGLRYTNLYESKCGWSTYRCARGFLSRRDYVLGVVGQYEADIGPDKLALTLNANVAARSYLTRYKAAHPG